MSGPSSAEPEKHAEERGTESSPASAERSATPCITCAEPIAEPLEARPGYCFVCAVHVVCACADES